MEPVFAPTKMDTRFFDNASKREMLLIGAGPYKGWIAYKHPDGQWVTLRKATEADHSAIRRAIVEAHHAD